MRRREFITLLCGTSAAALPVAAFAQQRRLPVVGFLGTRASGEGPQLLMVFRRGPEEVGYVEGQNLVMEYRFAENQYDRLPTLAAHLVRHQVAVIVANGRAAQVAKERPQRFRSPSWQGSTRSRWDSSPA
jgi:putative tryptophan/tyrosine transport system substrate-binding protein